MYMYFVPQIFIWGTSMYANFVVTITGLNLKTKDMKIEEFYTKRYTIIPVEENAFDKEELFEFAEAYTEHENKELKDELNKKRMDNYSLHDKCDKVVQDSGHLEAEIKELKEERQRDAIDGQSALDEANNKIKELKDLLIQINKHCYLGELTDRIKQALNQ